VGVRYAAVRRWHGPAAGLLAGATFALTPVAALMFLVVPAFALVYLVAAPSGLRRRTAQLAAVGVALVVTAG
jgi:hypothetical protein